MSLSQKLNQASGKASELLCKAGKLLKDPNLGSAEKAQLTDIFNAPNGANGVVSNSVLAQILREEGYDISKSMLDRHRGHSCTCYRKVQG